MLYISLVNYGVRSKQAAPRNKFIGMARFLRFVLRQNRQVKYIGTLKSLRKLKNFATSGSSRNKSKSRFKLAWTPTFTVVSSWKFQTWWFFLNASVGRWKLCDGPHGARGPLIAHPWGKSFEIVNLCENNNSNVHLC